MGLRTIFRLFYMIVRRPKQALFFGFITSLFLAIIGLFFGVQYVIGDFSKVDLNFPTADFNSIGNYTRISGSTSSAWGCFYINNECYYVIPKFDNNTDPTCIVQVLVVNIESQDASAWKALSASTKRRFTHTSVDPATPVRVDGYAHNMNDLLRGSSLEYLKSIGFTDADAEKLLVPYVVYYDMANKYSTLTFGGIMALISVVCLFVWIRKGMNFRD